MCLMSLSFCGRGRATDSETAMVIRAAADNLDVDAAMCHTGRQLTCASVLSEDCDVGLSLTVRHERTVGSSSSDELSADVNGSSDDVDICLHGWSAGVRSDSSGHSEETV